MYLIVHGMLFQLDMVCVNSIIQVNKSPFCTVVCDKQHLKYFVLNYAETSTYLDPLFIMTNIHIAKRAPLTTCTKVGKTVVTEKRNAANRSGTTTCKKKNNNNAATRTESNRCKSEKMKQ